MCSGVDCSGGGSGAALIELEELCQERGVGEEVVSGTCTLQCGVGPIVNVHSVGATGSWATVHHCRVDTPQRCLEVVEGARATFASVMLRRAAGMRWTALRSRTHAGRRARERSVQLLTAALQAEATAAKANPAWRARAERRAARLAS